MATKLGTRIKEMRVTRHLSQKELAEKTNILNMGNINFLENYAKTIKPEALKAICNALDCTPKDLGLEEDSKPIKPEVKKGDILLRISKLDDSILKYVEQFINILEDIKSEHGNTEK